MQHWNGLADIPDLSGGTVVTLGNFDGVHRGHRAVLSRVVQEAGTRDLSSVAITFDPHPVAVLHPERAPLQISSMAERIEWIAETGIDAVLVIEFTHELAQQSPEEFVRETFVDALGARVIVVGKDTRFGVRNSGDVNTLRELGAHLGFEVIALDDLGDDERWSSTAVRRHLVDGDVSGAAQILGRPHAVTGEVVHGHHRGRELGFPTANLAPDSSGLVPEDGVYAGWLTRLDLPENAPRRTMPSAVSVGSNPTFDTNDRSTVEAYVLDRTDLDLYGETVRVDFVERLRPTLRFDGVDALIAQMNEDVARCREILAGPLVPPTME